MTLEAAVRLLREEIAPRAQELDRNPVALGWALGRLAEEGLLALRRPKEFGGPELPEEAFRQFQEEIARTSGALAFLQTQHQSAVGLIAKGENESLMAEYLPRMHDGGRLVGIGFSQLRRPGPPVFRAEPTDGGGYRLDGTVPWVTGESFFPEFLAGAALADGRAVFGIVPLGSGPGIQVSAPMDLCAMANARTVSVEFDGYRLEPDRVAFVKPAGWIRRNDMINVALQGHFAMGCAQAAIDLVGEQARKRGHDFLFTAHDALAAELAELRAATRSAQAGQTGETTQERLAVRAWAIEFALRCASSAVAASSGAANWTGHPAQRVYREALVYTVSAQTTEIMGATLERLAQRKAPG